MGIPRRDFDTAASGLLNRQRSRKPTGSIPGADRGSRDDATTLTATSDGNRWKGTPLMAPHGSPDYRDSGLEFPSDLLLGSASASYQIEGAVA